VQNKYHKDQRGKKAQFLTSKIPLLSNYLTIDKPQAYLMVSANSTTTDPGCHGNEIWAKIGYNSAYMWDISEILASNRGFSGSAYWAMSVDFFRDRPWLPWQRNLGQNWL